MYQVPEEIQSRSGVDTDVDRVRGIIIASSFLEVANEPLNLRKIGAVASIIGVGQLIFEGATIENVDWEDELNWKQYGGATVEICEQTDVEQAIPAENTKATSALRAWQGFVYWCANTVFTGLNTVAKTVIGAINELLGALELKAMQFVGVCKRINFNPIDIVIDSVNNTISIASVNGVPISESNPFRCFTDGDGIVIQHVITSPVTASFTNTSGVWYVHFDSNGDFICTQTPWSDFDTVATIYRFYLNATLDDSEKIVVRAYEAHENVMSSETHQVLHNGFGTIHVKGFDLIHNVLPINTLGVPTVNPNADGRNAVISLTEGKNSDDGLEYHVTHSTSPTLPFSQNLGVQSAISLNATNSGLFKIRTNDANGLLNFLQATRFPFAFNTGTNIPQFITSTGVRTDVPDNNWFVYYAYALQDDKVGEPIKTVSAETAFTTFTLAQNHDWLNLQMLYPTLRDKEIRPLYKLIFYANYIVPSVYPIVTKYCGLVDRTDIRTIRPSTITTSGGGGGLVLASNVIVTPPSGYVSTDQQSFDSELASNTIKGNTTVHTALIDADIFGVWDSVAGVFKRISAATVKAYVKLNLLTSQITNSSNLFGTTLDDVLNTSDAIEKPSIQDGDALALSRMNLGVAENIFVLAENAKAYFSSVGVLFVKNAAELETALITESASVNIFVTEPITGVTFSNITPTLINIRGAKLSIATTVIPNSTISSNSKFFIDNEVYIGSTEPRISALTNTFSFYFRYLTADYPILLSGTGGGVLNIYTDNLPVTTVESGTVNIVTENNFFEKYFTQTQYVCKTWAEMQAILANPNCQESVVITFTEDVYVGALKTYAKNITIRGTGIYMFPNETLNISTYLAGVFVVNIDMSLLIGNPVAVNIGDTDFVSSITVNIKHIYGLTSTGTPALSCNKVGGSNTAAIYYNDAVNTVFTGGLSALRSDIFFPTMRNNRVVRFTGADISLNEFDIAEIDTYFELISVHCKYISGGTASMDIKIQCDNVSDILTDVTTVTDFNVDVPRALFEKNGQGFLFYEPVGVSLPFHDGISSNIVIANTTPVGKTVRTVLSNSNLCVVEFTITTQRL